MPYADPEKQREYKANWARNRRQGSTGTAGLPCLPTAPLRLGSSQDVLDTVSFTIGQVQSDHRAGTLENARVIGFLGGEALKALEAADPRPPGGARVRAAQQVPVESISPPPWSRLKLEHNRRLKRLSLTQLDALHDILMTLHAEDQAEGVTCFDDLAAGPDNNVA